MTDTFTSRCYSGSWSHIVTDIPGYSINDYKLFTVRGLVRGDVFLGCLGCGSSPSEPSPEVLQKPSGRPSSNSQHSSETAIETACTGSGHT